MFFVFFAWFDCTNSPSSPYMTFFTPIGFFSKENLPMWSEVFYLKPRFQKSNVLKGSLWRHHFFAGPLCKVDAGGNATRVHQVDEKLSQKEATKMKEPPCHLGGLYKAGKMLQIGPPLWILGNIHHPTNEKDVHIFLFVWAIWVFFRGVVLDSGIPRQQNRMIGFAMMKVHSISLKIG